MLTFIRYISYPITSLGPGSRLGIWFSGCRRSCKNCLSPDLKCSRLTDLRSVETISRNIEKLAGTKRIDGLTISGGEPLLQLSAVTSLCRAARKAGINDILLFTGYKLDEIDETRLGILKDNVSVLVSGEYRENDNDPLDEWGAIRGSNNQVISFFDNSLRSEYTEHCKKGSQADVIRQGNSYRIVGIPH